MATIADLYRGILGKAPDAEGAAYWQSKLDSGMSMNDLASMLQQYATPGTPQYTATQPVAKPDYNNTWQALQTMSQTGDLPGSAGTYNGPWQLANGGSQMERTAVDQTGAPQGFTVKDTAKLNQATGQWDTWQQNNPTRDNGLGGFLPYALAVGGTALGMNYLFPSQGGAASAGLAGTPPTSAVAPSVPATGVSGAGGIAPTAAAAPAVGSAAGTTATTAATGGGLFNTVKNLASNPLVGALAGGVLGGVGGSSQSGTQTSTTKNEIDPRMAPYVYGDNGIVPKIMGQLNTPQSPGLKSFGAGADVYLGVNGANDMQNLRSGANRLLSGDTTAPTVNAPGQNNINLSGAYNDFIYGQPGANPYLTGAIQRGINQSTNAFNNVLTDSTRNFNENILPNIRGSAIINGQMGGSRQGIAEGRAANDYSTQIGRALTQFGQNNTDAAVTAQAGAYDADRSRALSALGGLSGQQYGVAGQNLSSELDTNRLNSGNILSGINAGSGLLGQTYNYGTNNDTYNLNRIGQVSNLLTPYTGLGASQTQMSPLYENKTAGILGGALLGQQLLKGILS